MNSRSFLAMLLLGGAMAAPLDIASAERIKQNSAAADKAFETCENAGAPTKEGGGVKSCITGDGHGIVCGGPKPDHKGTCDTFRRSGKHPPRQTAIERSRMKAAAMAPAH